MRETSEKPMAFMQMSWAFRHPHPGKKEMGFLVNKTAGQDGQESKEREANTNNS